MNRKFISRVIAFEDIEPASTSTGIDWRISGVLANFFGLVWVFVETQNVAVRYLAVQSLFLWAAWGGLYILTAILSGIPLFGLVFYAVNALLTLLLFGGLGYVSYQAYNGTLVVISCVEKYVREWSRPNDDGPRLP